jgi:replicative DNA helicase
MFLSREDMYTTLDQWAEQHPDLPESAYPKGVAQVIVAKDRNGPTGTIELRFREKLARFEDWVLRRDDFA